jgi:hypothetical protein
VSYESTHIETNNLAIDVPFSSSYQFENSKISVGATVIWHLNKSSQTTFSTSRMSKKLKSSMLSNDGFLGLELFAEYQFSKELSYVISYNSPYSTFYFGGLNYAF